VQKHFRYVAISGVALLQASCGTGIPRIPETWDLVADTDATQHMEMQIKRAIFCELRDAVQIARNRVQYKTYYHGKLVSTAADQPVPDTWGVQQTLTFTVDELSCTRFRRHRVRCFMEQEVCHGETSVYARVQA
jgi:hypothetical protein